MIREESDAEHELAVISGGLDSRSAGASSPRPLQSLDPY